MMANKLLVVEDSKVFSEMLKTLIEQAHGMSVDVVESYTELKTVLSLQAGYYFAAVVDRHLPDAQDGEAIDLVVKNHIPTIVFTGTADEAMEEDLWEKNISDYAHKSSAHSLEYVVWMVKRLQSNMNEEVLVVDDSIVARKTMRKLLRTQCFKVHIAESGKIALDILSENPNIRLAILDCKMDGMDGFELASRIRETRDKDSLEIIGVSSSGGRSNSARFIKAGADDFLLKPFMPEEFLCRVNRAVDRIDQYDKLKALNKLKNQFLSTAAHDIRGPLSAIYNASKLLQKKDCDPKRKEIVLKMIENNSFDMQILLNDLLDISVIESGEVSLRREPINLQQTITDRVHLYSTMSEAKNIVVSLQLEDVPEIGVDRIKLNQAIDNLITNALKFTPNEGNVQLELSTTDNKAIIRVSDSGPGISSEDQPYLFEPYKILSAPSTAGEKKTGLGLVITKNIVTAHNGSIHYEDSSLGGANFTIELPYEYSALN